MFAPELPVCSSVIIPTSPAQQFLIGGGELITGINILMKNTTLKKFLLHAQPRPTKTQSATPCETRFQNVV